MAIARSTLAQWVGERGAQLQPLVDALSAELLRHDVLHADETLEGMLKPGPLGLVLQGATPKPVHCPEA